MSTIVQLSFLSCMCKAWGYSYLATHRMGCIHVLKHRHAGASDDIFLAAIWIRQRYQAFNLSHVWQFPCHNAKLSFFWLAVACFARNQHVGHGPHPRTYVLCTEKHTDQKNGVLTTTESDQLICSRIVHLPIFCATIRYFWGRCILPIDTVSLFCYNYV